MTAHDEERHVDPKVSVGKTDRQATALCLSGGGYRAMVFHVGTLWRLNDAGMLPKIDLISSVSGGSITAGCLAKNWKDLAFDPNGVATLFKQKFVEPIRKMAGTTIDIRSVLAGLFLPKVTTGDRVAANYRRYLFGDATMQDLPDTPEFAINATNLQSAANWRFSKREMGDYRVGKISRPAVSLATAVAASSAFPPFLCPVILNLDPTTFTPKSGMNLQIEPYTTRVVLGDGGIYDNLGLEAPWKSYPTILVSDAGAKIDPEPSPKADWFRLLLRVLDIEDDQVRNLRKRELIAAYNAKPECRHLSGAYWGIRTDISQYPIPDYFPCSLERTTELAAVSTRLARLDATVQDRLINWGYAVCDAALRSYVNKTLTKPAFLPYPQTGI